MTAPLRVGVVGAGYFSRFHLDGWARIPEARLVGVADLDPGKAAAALTAAVGPSHGARVFADAAEMLDAAALDILDIATPPPTHAALIRQALGAPLRAIICQKPFCADLEEARAVSARAEAAGRPLIVHENFRFQPWYRRLAAALHDGEIGAPRQLAFRFRPGDGQGPRAYLDRQPYFRTMRRFLVHETAIHWIDTFRYLFGEPDAVFADLRRLNPAVAGEDAGHVLYLYDDGRRALFDGDRHLDHAAENRRLTMGEAACEGVGGEIRLDGDGRLRRRRHGDDAWTHLDVATPTEGFGGDCVRALQAHVCAHLLRGAALENAAAAYLRNLEIEAAVYRSAETGAVVRLDPPAMRPGGAGP